MAWVRAWAAGVVVLIVTEHLRVTLLYEPLAGSREPRSFGAALLLAHLPNLVCIALATWAAARMHPQPRCRAPLRHMAAACAVPVAAQSVTPSALWSRPLGLDAAGLWPSNGVLVGGCAVGRAADRWRRAAH